MFTLDYDGIDDGHLYADRVDGTAIASSVLGVDPDSLVVSPVANAGAATLAVGGYVGNLGVYSFNGSTFSTTSIMTTSGSAAAWGIAFSPDGQLLAAGTDDGSVRFWAAPFTTNATSGLPITLGSSYVPTRGRVLAARDVHRDHVRSGGRHLECDDAGVRVAAQHDGDPRRQQSALRHLRRVLG